MADYIPKFKPGSAVTFTASADVTGGRLVEITGNRAVGPAGADSAKVFGVAARDTEAGDTVLVYGPGIHTLTASAAVAAGAQVAAAADGKVAGTGTNFIGIAITAAAKADDVIEVRI